MILELLPFSEGIAKELMKQGAMMTVLGTLVTALAWPATLLSVTNFIDSKWTIAVDRYSLSLKYLKTTRCGKKVILFTRLC